MNNRSVFAPRFAVSRVVVLLFAASAFSCAGCGSGIGKVAAKVGTAVVASALNQDNYDNQKPFNGVTARCTDGTYTTSLTPKLACDPHGGIDQRFDKP